MATTIVDPDSGAGWDYDSLFDWEANQQGSLSAPEIATCRCTGGSNDTTAFTIDGWTTSAANYIKIWTDLAEAYRHPGYWITGNYYRLVVSNTAAIEVKEADVRIEGLMINVSSVDAADQNTITLYPNASVVADIQISKNILQGAGTIDDNGYHCGVGMWGFDSGSSGQVDIWNNMIYNFGSSSNNYSNAGINFYNQTGAAMYVDCFVYNNTVQSCCWGYWAEGNESSSNNMYLKNNIVKDTYQSFMISNGASWGTSSTHNIGNATGGDSDQDLFGVTHSTGTATSYGANKLNDSGGGLSDAQVGSVVENTSDSTSGYVTVVDSDTQLTLNTDIFDTGDENYIVYTNMWGSVTFQDEGSDEFLLDSSDTAAKDKGTNLSADPDLPFSDDILDTTRT